MAYDASTWMAVVFTACCCAALLWYLLLVPFYLCCCTRSRLKLPQNCAAAAYIDQFLEDTKWNYLRSAVAMFFMNMWWVGAWEMSTAPMRADLMEVCIFCSNFQS